MSEITGKPYRRKSTPHTVRLLAVAVCLLFLQPASSRAQTTPAGLPIGVGIDQRLGQQVPLDAVFRNEAGRTVRLGDYFGNKPVILSLVYYDCPMLCTLSLNGLLRSLQLMNLSAGREFEIITVSFDPRETPVLASAKKNVYLTLYNRPGAWDGWHFLTGDEVSIRRLTDAVGFRYKWDEQSGQYAHAAGILVLTPQGKVSHYLYGIEYPARDLRLSLVEASRETIGSPVDQVLLFCYHYDPATGKYGLVVTRALQLGAALTVLILGSFMLVSFLHDRRRSYE